MFFGAANIFSIHRAAVIGVRLLQRIRITIYSPLLFARQSRDCIPRERGNFKENGVAAYTEIRVKNFQKNLKNF